MAEDGAVPPTCGGPAPADTSYPTRQAGPLHFFVPDLPDVEYLAPPAKSPAGYMLYVPKAVMATSLPWNPEETPSCLGPPQYPSSKPVYFVADGRPRRMMWA